MLAASRWSGRPVGVQSIAKRERPYPEPLGHHALDELRQDIALCPRIATAEDLSPAAPLLEYLVQRVVGTVSALPGPSNQPHEPQARQPSASSSAPSSASCGGLGLRRRRLSPEPSCPYTGW
jgi:hypothetical protein